jgi:hypothetical protein
MAPFPQIPPTYHPLQALAPRALSSGLPRWLGEQKAACSLEPLYSSRRPGCQSHLISPITLASRESPKPLSPNPLEASRCKPEANRADNPYQLKKLPVKFPQGGINPPSPTTMHIDLCDKLYETNFTQVVLTLPMSYLEL